MCRTCATLVPYPTDAFEDTECDVFGLWFYDSPSLTVLFLYYWVVRRGSFTLVGRGALTT